MLGLKIKINNGEAIVGGADDLATLTAYVSAAGVLGPKTHHPRPDEPPDLWVTLRGLTSRPSPDSDEHLAWLQQHPLRVGDSITIEVVETEEPDVPVSRRLAGETAQQAVGADEPREPARASKPIHPEPA